LSVEKSRIVEESLVPGATVAEVARRHDVHANLLHHWRRQARLGSNGEGLSFLPVTVSAETRPASARGAIEIELMGVRVRVDAAVDEAALGRVLRVLGR
jgi:transposase